MPRWTMTTAERFFSYVSPEPNSGCWLWIGAVNEHGYGIFYLSRPTKAHRASWILHRGKIPEGCGVLHRCDVPCCVNPDHLFIGTQSENMMDCAQKLRHVHGERNGNSKLTTQQVQEIKSACALSKQREVAKRFGISEAAVSMIINGERRRIS